MIGSSSPVPVLLVLNYSKVCGIIMCELTHFIEYVIKKAVYKFELLQTTIQADFDGFMKSVIDESRKPDSMCITSYLNEHFKRNCL